MKHHKELCNSQENKKCNWHFCPIKKKKKKKGNVIRTLTDGPKNFFLANVCCQFDTNIDPKLVQVRHLNVIILILLLVLHEKNCPSSDVHIFRSI